MFVELPRYISCNFRGVNSPVILRAEAGAPDGGMLVEELHGAGPNVTIYGTPGSARVAFENALAKLRQFLDQTSAPKLKPLLSDRWFRIEYRHSSNYVATFWGDTVSYDFHWVTAPGVAAPNLEADYNTINDRLLTLYERFFHVQL